MAQVCASGGYYISSLCDSIVADETTITGSIGVVAGKFVTEKLLKEKLGISYDSVESHANSKFYSSLKEYDDEMRKAFRRGLDHYYDLFVSRVSQGRNILSEEGNFFFFLLLLLLFLIPCSCFFCFDVVFSDFFNFFSFIFLFSS